MNFYGSGLITILIYGQGVVIPFIGGNFLVTESFITILTESGHPILV